MDYKRTHTCGELRGTHVGERVRLSGWVHRRRDLGGLIFIDLRDRYGRTQLLFNPEANPEAYAQAEKLRHEWVITVEGEVSSREEANQKLATGEVEIIVSSLSVLSKAKTSPITISDEKTEVNEDLRLKYRYLDMRKGKILDNLVLRHQAMMCTRRVLDQHGFVEVQTPILGKTSPEGARDYLVPSRVHPGNFYALPQSPQMFKQVLMVGGLDRYFQIAPCFRDEDLRAERQPEFTQIDLELSFGTEADLFPIIEHMLQEMFDQAIGAKLPKEFRRMTHKEALESYGTDKPDLRFGMELIDLSTIAEQSDFVVFKDTLASQGIVKGICVEQGADVSRKGIDALTQFVQQFGVKGLAWVKLQNGELKGSVGKFFTGDLGEKLIQAASMKEGDLLLMIADSYNKTHQALDHLRRKIAEERSLVDPNRIEALWVTDFPLFAWNEEEECLESEHHPFTSPNYEDLELLEETPLQVRSSSYDLVINGYECASGSQRIHDGALQKKIFELLQLGPDQIEQRFGWFVEALQYGTPPHLGIALGLDRLIMILAQTQSIRDVIAFPKTLKASDVMMSTPSSPQEGQLGELSLQVKCSKENTLSEEGTVPLSH